MNSKAKKRKKEKKKKNKYRNYFEDVPQFSFLDLF